MEDRQAVPVLGQRNQPRNRGPADLQPEEYSESKTKH